MDYSKSLLLYQDKPDYGLLLKIIIVLAPVALLVGSIFLFLSGDSTGFIVLLIEACFISLTFWGIFPRSYQVYEDHLRIVLGGPFSVKIRFADIESIEITSELIISLNFTTKITRIYVAINKKGDISFAITPRDNSLFVENANNALSRWEKAKQNR